MIKEHDDTCSQDVCGRVYKHFFKVTTTTAQGKSLEECARSFVDRAFRGYASAGGKKDWFYAIDFSPAFACAVWEILAIRCRLVPNLSFQGLSVFVPKEVDKQLYRKFGWRHCVRRCGGYFSSNILFKACTKSLQLSLARPCQNYSAVDLFLMHWVDDSMRLMLVFTSRRIW